MDTAGLVFHCTSHLQCDSVSPHRSGWYCQHLLPTQARKHKEMVNKTKESLNKVEWEIVFHLIAPGNATRLPLVAGEKERERESTFSHSVSFHLSVSAFFLLVLTEHLSLSLSLFITTSLYLFSTFLLPSVSLPSL